MSAPGIGHGEGARPRTLTQDPDQGQAVVLGVVLHAFPEELTEEELIREITQGTVTRSEQLDIERAVGELVGFGLLHPDRTRIRPTRAALRFHRLHQIP